MKYVPHIIVAAVFVAVAFGAYWYWSRQPTQPQLAAFRMPIDDAFGLEVVGKVVVVGKIAEGEVRPGDRLTIKMLDGEISVQVEAIEAFGEPISVGSSGQNVGVMLVGASKEQIRPGAVLAR